MSGYLLAAQFPLDWLDASGLTHAEKRAELLVRQLGLCAVCGRPRPPHADHCHDTGFLRGLLCPGCNNRARRNVAPTPGVAAYLQDPPAAGLHWIWELPGWWEIPADTYALGRERVTVAAYVLARPGEAARRHDAAMAAARAALQGIKW